ncbi:hypothetical protein ACFXD5_11945 [Streptomyces sp. NPDC059385]|uniref:hypothetical protein n=1 Tax=Streptomyces sp. NPDC059385 TaxID=3346817 RepID=UPI0036822AEE
MDVSYMVRAVSEAECQRELDELCAALGAVATMAPIPASGHGWMARAVKTKAPAVGEGLAVER